MENNTSGGIRLVCTVTMSSGLTVTLEKTFGTSGFCGLLTIAFIVLKLCKVISWSWIWVLAPAWIPIAISIILLLILKFVFYK